MTGIPGADPIALLRFLEQRAEACQAEPPVEGAARRTWRGVAFSLAERRLIVSVSTVQEVLPCLNVSHLTGTKAWLKGITHVPAIGVLPVLDLQELLCARPTPVDGRTRILVTAGGALMVGAVVSEVFGIKTFREGQRFSSAPRHPAEACIAPYVRGGFTGAEAEWIELDLAAVLEMPELLEVAA